jgi:hypothetical protein
MLEILRTPEFEFDRDQLVEPGLHAILDMLIERIATGEHVVKKALGKVKGLGDLRGCWAIKFDLLGYPNRYRSVIRYLPHDFAPTEVLLIAVGPRFDGQVYRWADSRLNR